MMGTRKRAQAIKQKVELSLLRFLFWLFLGLTLLHGLPAHAQLTMPDQRRSLSVSQFVVAFSRPVSRLIKIPLARPAGSGGIIAQVAWVSPNGSTSQIVVRIWQRNPYNTTCTDNTAFSGSSTDDIWLVTPPFGLTPAATAATTADAKTYAVLTQQSFDWKNSDPPSVYLYACVVTVATDTADESSSPWIVLSGSLN